MGGAVRSTLLRPGWIASLLLVGAFAVACFTVLAPWQFDKGEALDRRPALIDRAEREQAVPLEAVQHPDDILDPSDEWRRVTVRGHYVPGTEVLLRHRVVAGETVTYVLTPFRVAGAETVILVNRGFIDSNGDTTTQPVVAPQHDTTITAQLRTAEEASRFTPPRAEDETVVASAIDPAGLEHSVGQSLAPYYLQLAAGQTGALGELPPPNTQSGVPHFWYGVQWAVFGVLAPVALGVLGWSHVRSAMRSRIR